MYPVSLALFSVAGVLVFDTIACLLPHHIESYLVNPTLAFQAMKCFGGGES